MLINEDYFKDLEIEDEDIIEDDYLDDEEPEHEELTLEKAKELPKQYDHLIRFTILNHYTNKNNIKIQTSLLPRIIKRLDAIFELYGIEHS